MIDHSNRICGWQESLPKDEMPPEWMWPYDDALVDWFEMVEIKREEKYGGGASSDSESGSYMSNEYADELRSG